MQTGTVTTPFGRRPITLTLVRRQTAMAEIKQGKTADKWKVFRDVAAAMDSLGLHSNSVAVLDALLTFHPKNELCQNNSLVVFPSNTQLALRAHGMSGAAMRRHIAILVDAGLILRKDSPNGKRYARKDHTGEIENAFGFDLSPLLARSEELAAMAQQVATARAMFRSTREALTICRRDVRKLITAAIEEGAKGDWQAIEGRYVEIVGRIPRAPTLATVSSILDEMRMLYEEIISQLNIQDNFENKSTNVALIEQHIQSSKPEYPNEFEPASEKDQEAKPSKDNRRRGEPLKVFPLSVVMKACPMIVDYGVGSGVGSWRDLMAAAVVVRSMLGISPSAYQEACEAMGPENAAVAVACILERSTLISSPGGYLRDLSRRTSLGEFSLGPMIMAALKTNSESRTRVG
ncbi:replication initiation protein RepC [Rhizobium sp. CFBP 8752]|uniref:plasmid replication protein RepC n=1 Tax=Rhizobium sp. CFBP 8752 TaxID=2775301 RepID=UPI001785A977|nr:plasmid replication protein RepC [Rhizobium sp. CFBP 8752]MBD8665897.1 replication initiation protein RepC [Rhizobium sp. CFBP 8752]